MSDMDQVQFKKYIFLNENLKELLFDSFWLSNA